VGRSSGLASGVVLYEPDELVLRVGAGTPLVEVSALLAAHRQRLRIPSVGSVGGALATRRNGIRPADNNALPNIVLMVRAIDGTGAEFTAGGPTVKNVSGFDLVKLLVGSWGVLATITEATIRTEPIPASSRWWKGRGSVDDLYRPSVVWADGEEVIVNIEGHPDDVSEQARLLSGFKEIEAPSADEELALNPSSPPVGFAHGPSLEICRRLKAAFDPCNTLNPELSTAWGLV
jgi:FAD/FMN-containing dehydrogenase